MEVLEYFIVNLSVGQLCFLCYCEYQWNVVFSYFKVMSLICCIFCENSRAFFLGCTSCIFLVVKIVLCSVAVLFPCDHLWPWLYCCSFKHSSVYCIDKTIQLNMNLGPNAVKFWLIPSPVCKKVCILAAFHFLSFRYIWTFLFINTAELHSLFLHLVCFRISDNKKILHLRLLHSAMFHSIIITPSR
jgi:hypothetical protein